MSLKPGEVKRFTCPFCGAVCEAGNHIIEGLSEPVYGVIHAQPVCEHFNVLEPDEFLVAVNNATLPPDILARLKKVREAHGDFEH